METIKSPYIGKFVILINDFLVLESKA